jgi:hypothetical protein
MSPTTSAHRCPIPFSVRRGRLHRDKFELPVLNLLRSVGKFESAPLVTCRDPNVACLFSEVEQHGKLQQILLVEAFRTTVLALKRSSLFRRVSTYRRFPTNNHATRLEWQRAVAEDERLQHRAYPPTSNPHAPEIPVISMRKEPWPGFRGWCPSIQRRGRFP